MLWINTYYQPSAILGSVNNNFQLIGYNNGIPRLEDTKCFTGIDCVSTKCGHCSFDPIKISDPWGTNAFELDSTGYFRVLYIALAAKIYSQCALLVQHCRYFCLQL